MCTTAALPGPDLDLGMDLDLGFIVDSPHDMPHDIPQAGVYSTTTTTTTRCTAGADGEVPQGPGLHLDLDPDLDLDLFDGGWLANTSHTTVHKYYTAPPTLPASLLQMLGEAGAAGTLSDLDAMDGVVPFF